MQIYFIYFGLPQFNPALTIKSAFVAAMIAYTLNTAAYLAENIRAGLESIDAGQHEAAKALGMSYSQTMKLIIIPQTIRRLIPPVGNEFIMVLKDVSLVAIIGLSDLTKVTRAISSSSATALVYIPAMIIYLIITALFTFIFNRAEKKYSVYHPADSDYSVYENAGGEIVWYGCDNRSVDRKCYSVYRQNGRIKFKGS